MACFVLVELIVDGVLDGAKKWQIKCFGAFLDVDGSGSGVGFGEVVAKVLVLHGGFVEVFNGARPSRLVCSFLLKDGGLDFPSMGLLSWLLLDVAVMDFFWVVNLFSDAGFILFQGQDDGGQSLPEGRYLAATNIGGLVGHLS